MHLSFSGERLFAHCPRKWQLLKLLDTGESVDTLIADEGIHIPRFLKPGEESLDALVERKSTRKDTHTNYGTTFGAAAATLLLSGGDIEAATLVAFQTWDDRYASTPKTFPALLTSLQRLHEAFDYAEYKPLALPDGRPAAELGTRIWLNDERTDYYVLFPDIIMLDSQQRPTIIEVKTTKNSGPLLPAYANSSQAILYSLPVLFLFPQYDVGSWKTLYIVNQVTSVRNPAIHLLPVDHLEEERLGALMGVILRYESLRQMVEVDYFPKTAGGDCVSYGHVCDFFGICDYLAQTCKQKPVEEQNRLSVDREGSIVLDLDMHELIAHELELQQQRKESSHDQ